MKRWLFAAILLLGFALWQSVGYGVRMRRECLRLKANQSGLLSDIGHYRVRDSLQAASIRVLTLKASEFESHFTALTALVRDMGMKVKRLEAVSQNAIESHYEFRAPVRDTVVLAQAAQAVHFDNGHLTMEGLIASGEFRGRIISRDTLTQVVHRIPRRFLFIRWGTRELRQEIISSNPHSRIVYSRYIKLERGRP